MIREDLDLSKVEFGLVASVFLVVYGLMVPVAGYAGDVMRRKWVVLASLLIFSLATLLTGMATGLLALIAFRAVATGGGEALYYPAANSLIGQFHHKTRAMAMAIHQTALYAGIICSSFAALVGQYYGWRAGFFVFGGFGVLMAGVVLWRMHDTALPESTSSSRGHLEDPGEENSLNQGREKPNNPAAKGPSIAEVLAYISSKPTIIFMSIAFAGMVFVDNGYKTWMPTFLEEDHALSPFAASFWSMSAHYVGAFLGVMAGGSLSDRFAPRRSGVRVEIEYLGLMLGAPFILWMGLAGGAVTCCVALFGFGLFRGVYDSNLFAAPFDVIEPRYRSSAVGMMLSCAFVVGASSSVLLAWMAQSVSMGSAIASMSLVYVAAGGILVIARYKFYAHDRIEESAMEPKG